VDKKYSGGFVMRLRKIVAVILTAVLINSFFGNCFTFVFAAGETPVNIIVDSFENGTLKFHWNQPAGAKAAVISYHRPIENDKAELVVQDAVLNDNKGTITGLLADYIYDITVTVYGNVDIDNKPSGSPIGRGILFYLPSITFNAEAVGQEAEKISESGGYQIGHKPGLKLSWKEPKSFYDPDHNTNSSEYPVTDPDSSNNVFIKASTPQALSYMESLLNIVYKQNKDLSSLDYLINISTHLNLLNAGSDQTSLLVEQQAGGGYKAFLSGKPGVSADVTAPDGFGFVSFQLLGRADETSQIETPADPHILPDEDILPGTVYYMNIKPIFKNSGGASEYAVTVGKPSDLNGSMLAGERPYTSTPVRFQLSRDSANNIYVKIYKINQGSLYLPRLYYEVQVSDDPNIPYEWAVKKTMDDSYFIGTTAITVITGINPNNRLYYRIVVKSDSPDDRLQSLPMPYTLTVDTSRPPLPTGVAVVDRNLQTARVINPSGVEITVKSSDITISWEKPLNWSTIDKNDLYFHFLLNTNQSEIASPVPLYVNGSYWGSYPARYRLVKYVSAASGNIKEDGNRLTYTLKAFELFQPDGAPAGDTIPNTENYPTFLIPNTVYYLQMFTTTAENRGTSDPAKMSDKSIVISFTTLNGTELEVPLPMNFGVAANSADTALEPPLNYIDLRFDKVMNLDWRNYAEVYDTTNYTYDIFYDLFMSTRTDTLSFIQIGTTENLNGDVVFKGADDAQSTSVETRISQFTDQNLINRFGSRLLPNTTYYFKVRTRLVVKDKSDGTVVLTKTSVDTAILPVTTIVTKVTPPDDSTRKPLAPTDFRIALDENSNLLVSDYSVTFTWKRQEDDVIYELIRTSGRVNPTDEYGSFDSDPEYLSFLQEYDVLSDGKNNGKVYLDPVLPAGRTEYPDGNFTYDPDTKTCTYTVDRRIFPNKLYYFSLKAVRVKNDSSREPISPSAESVWVSIPVTTLLIDPPVSLEPVVNAELGFWWTDDTAGLTAEDYRIYVKGPSDTEYKLMKKSQSTIVKDKDGKTYYGRITGLKLNTSYDIQVIKGNNVTIYERTGLVTRDGYHELEIRWKGKPVDDFSRYEIAIMAEGDPDYTVLTASDLYQYTDKNGKVLPYYTEETASTVNSDALYYYARIKSAEVILPGGIAARQPLRSNVKYYIKVRTVKVDPADQSFVAYSKYAGPVNIRTEFNQDDYDNTDREEQEKARFLDKVEDLESGYYWKVAAGNGITSILLKGERVADALRNTKADTFIIDMTSVSLNLTRDEIYVPATVIKAMNALDKSLIIRTPGSELQLRPETINFSENEIVKDILSKQGVKDIYVKLVITRHNSVTPALPANYQRVSDINELDVQAMGLIRTDSELRTLFHDRLYNEDTGLVSEKLNMLLKTYVGGGTGSSELIEKYTQSLINMIENELSAYIGNMLLSTKLSNTVRDIQSFETPASAKLAFSGGNGVKIPYVLYDGSANWQKIETGTVLSDSTVVFNLKGTGKYVILSAQSSISDVPAGHWAESYIKKLTSKYDLADVFSGVNKSFMPENIATCKEVVLLYEKVTGRDIENKGLDIKQKNTRLGLNTFINPNSLLKDVNRQQTAAVLIKLFSVKKGVNIERMRPGGIVYIEDEDNIGDEYYKSVLMVVDMGVMSIDQSGKFNPEGRMTRAEVVTAFVRMLELTGDI